ncbi:MAG: single-stranded-DNA-specific exonuclease RecJ [Clostridia bacterium]|nr:single-stranded-DNA-specific exonuclease RecJ [Clostridia bacterium]
MKVWSVAQLNKDRALKLSEQFGIPMICAALLDVRGINTYEAVEKFLSSDVSFDNPFEIKDMDKAVNRILSAVENGEKICIYGDYDADGVSATALLMQYLETIGADVSFYIPSRADEGYGLNIEAVNTLADNGVELLITVDNGISAYNEVELCNSLGVDVVITDHHTVPEVIPNAVAVVNPHRPDCKSKFKELSGVGVVFKLVIAMEGDYADVDMLVEEYADIAAIGTIGDIVSLTDENRTIAKHGIRKINDSDRAGVIALLKASGCYEKELTSTDISFSVVPRINAGGRLGLSSKSVELLLTDNEDYALSIASNLSEDNAERQKIEQDILKEIDFKIRENPDLIRNPIIIIDGENWHQGVIGIIAAKIKSLFGKACIIISKEGEIARASGRSIEGFALNDAIFACSEYLEHFGGHAMAVGFSLKTENIHAFKQALFAYYDSQDTLFLPTVKIDCKLNPALLNLELVDSLSVLEPFGAGNPSPLFGLYNMQITDVKALSNGKHQRLTVTRGGAVHTVMCFGMPSDIFPYTKGDTVDLAVSLDKNFYKNNIYLSIIARDIRYSGYDTERHLKSMRLYDRFVLDRDLPQKYAKYFPMLIPEREDFAVVYRYLKSVGNVEISLETLSYRLGSMPCGKLRTCLDAMAELSLISFFEGPKTLKITVLDVTRKVDIESAPILMKLREAEKCQK